MWYTRRKDPLSDLSRTLSAGESLPVIRTPWSSLRFRVLLLVLLAVLPALGLVIYTNVEQRRLAAAGAKEDALRLVRIAAADQNDTIKDTRQLLFALAQLPEVHGTDPATCSAFLARLLNQYPQYALLGVIERDGDLACSAPFAEGPVRLADRVYFQRTLQTRDFAVGDYQVDRVTGKATINFGQPVFDRADQVQAVVFASLDLTWLNDLASEAQLPTGSTFTLIDRNGTILVRYPNPEDWVGRSVPESQVVETILARRSEGTDQVRGIDGILRLFAFTPLSGAPAGEDVYLCVGIPRSVAFQKADQMLARSLIGLGLVSTLVLAAAWFGGDVFIVRRASQLVGAAKKLSAGDLGARTRLPHGGDELGQLASSFDEMAESLERQVALRDRAEGTLRRQIAFGNILATISRDFINLPPEEIDVGIVEALHIVGEFTRVDRIYVFLLTEDGKAMADAYEWHAEGVEPVVEKWREVPLAGFPWIGAMLSRGEILHVPQVEDLPPEANVDREALLAMDIRSFTSVPMMDREVMIGFLGFDSVRPEAAWSEEGITLLRLLGEIIVNALDRKRAADALQSTYQAMEQQVAERTRDLSALHDVMAAAGASLDLETVIEHSLEQVLAVMGCEIGAIHLLDEEEASLCLAVSRGVSPDLAGGIEAVPLDASLAGWALEQGKPVVVPRIANTQRPLRVLPALGEQTYVGVPMHVKGRGLGVLSVVREAGRPFDQEEVSLLASIADRVGVAVENAQLYQQAEQLAVMQERQRLARDLHDSVTQSLYSLVLITEAGRRLAGAKYLKRAEEAMARLGEIGQQALKEMRLLVYELRPSSLQQEGLERALRQRLGAVEKRAGIEASLAIEGTLAVPGTVEEELFRVAQEALNNTLKHAAATSVSVHIRADCECIEIEVADNGKGFEPDAVGDRAGMGLVSMRERMDKLGGTLTILSAPGRGTRVKVALGNRHPAGTGD
jgi:signal transduction histidine kinase/HAMP domain-containing protein